MEMLTKQMLLTIHLARNPIKAIRRKDITARALISKVRLRFLTRIQRMAPNHQTLAHRAVIILRTSLNLLLIMNSKNKAY
jgi:hypothetical protein